MRSLDSHGPKLSSMDTKDSKGPWLWQHAFCDTEISRDNFELLFCNSESGTKLCHNINESTCPYDYIK